MGDQAAAGVPEDPSHDHVYMIDNPVLAFFPRVDFVVTAVQFLYLLAVWEREKCFFLHHA